MWRINTFKIYYFSVSSVLFAEIFRRVHNEGHGAFIIIWPSSFCSGVYTFRVRFWLVKPIFFAISRKYLTRENWKCFPSYSIPPSPLRFSSPRSRGMVSRRMFQTRILDAPLWVINSQIESDEISFHSRVGSFNEVVSLIKTFVWSGKMESSGLFSLVSQGKDMLFSLISTRSLTKKCILSREKDREDSGCNWRTRQWHPRRRSFVLPLSPRAFVSVLCFSSPGPDSIGSYHLPLLSLIRPNVAENPPLSPCFLAIVSQGKDEKKNVAGGKFWEMLVSLRSSSHKPAQNCNRLYLVWDCKLLGTKSPLISWESVEWGGKSA